MARNRWMSLRVVILYVLRDARVRRKRMKDAEWLSWAYRLPYPLDRLVCDAFLRPTPEEFWDARRLDRLSQNVWDVPF